MEQVILVRQSRLFAPFCDGRQRAHRLDRLKFFFRDDSQKIAVANNLDDAGELLDRRRIAFCQLGAIARRTDETRMHHARQAHVLHVSGAAGDLGRNIDPRHRLSHHLVGRGILQIRFDLSLHVQHVARDQIAVTKTSAAGRDRAFARATLLPVPDCGGHRRPAIARWRSSCGSAYQGRTFTKG